MKERLVCNYAVIRFLPYPETEEFVNVGVILACPQTRIVDYRIEMRRRDRITGFFPELDVDVFTKGRADFNREMDRIRNLLNKNEPGQLEFRIQEKEFHQLFHEIVKPRESLFRFSGVGTVTANDVRKELDKLYSYYVLRQFAAPEEYQETIMANRLRTQLRAEDVLQFYAEKRFGDDEYSVKIPFVHAMTHGNGRLKGIKPLNLDKPDTTKILEHGDRWCMRIKRLRDKNSFPAEMLFVVRCPKSDKKEKAASQIVAALEQLETRVVPVSEQNVILDFAKAV
jgi:hypothetical protein